MPLRLTLGLRYTHSSSIKSSENTKAMAGDKPNPTQRPAPARGPGGGALQQRKRPARTASGGRRPAAQPGILRFYAEETPGLKIGPTTVRGRVAFIFIAVYCNRGLIIRIGGTHRWRRVLEIPPARHTRTPRHRHAHTTHAQVLVMSVMFVGFVVLLHIYGKLTAVPDAVDEDPIMPETPGADA